MTYAVKEIYYTLQGEGANTGRPAVFLRFAGCNLWTGREEDRADAVCTFCDTDFVGTDGPGGGKFATAEDLATYLSLRIAKFKLPREYIFIDSLPRTPYGKVEKGKLRVILSRIDGEGSPAAGDPSLRSG